MAEETNIRRLDDSTVDRIAAGEVVERPASVVKELVENSLDADATRIAVEVDRGGTDRIRVADDGVGMSEADLRAAVRQHTTSKISDIADLEAGVSTLGFRGEALHTIGAVSRMAITTKPRGSDGAGTTLRIEGGEVRDVEPAGCPEGTSIEVTDLFYNTPARKKFLSADATEFDHVNRIVTQYALANPDVAVSLEHDGREVFATTGQGDLPGTILSVYGREVATSMIPIEVGSGGDGGVDDDSADDSPSDDDRLDGSPIDGLSGYVSHPETTRASPHYVSTYVNGRYVTARPLRDAVVDAYGAQLAPDRYPFAVLFCSVPGDAVDVNVHPRKMEVRFDDEESVKRAVERAVEEALLDHGIVRTAAPRGRSAPAETTLSTEWDGGVGNEAVGRTLGTADGIDAQPGSHDPMAVDDTAVEGAGAGTHGSGARVPRTDDSHATSSESDTWSGSSESSAPGPTAPSTDGADTRRSHHSLSPSNGPHGDESSVPDGKFSEPADQTTFGDGPETDGFESLPPMRVLGQLLETYLVAESNGGLLLVDQHAADERVNYERLREEFEGDTTTQALVEPVELELTAREAALFGAYGDALAQLGFTAALREDGRTATVTRVPTVFDESIDPALLRDVLTSFVRSGEGGETVDATADALLADLACHPSITGNTPLTEGSIVDLLSALDGCENPYACPHGRPVVIEIGRDEIDDRFERDYPGHAGRRSD